ncbi:STAS/SEC14 domain-containing protein [Microbacterium sp. SSW1-59]|uniref:STAS/SEC14 domain-containing protein n=1 Tax=Microbacterium xanthum TaxID=3079794 RepID=UPI002AD342C8|nr:STAS/SEC14 domain-containing protein [Microbacterium sp. SSW1-59]MDZ8200196.1 STAS/SEC14 domain-containing protein [Microbacterium sp. SSW1-59]
MIEEIENAPAGVLGFRAVGEVTASDYETVLDPAIDRTLETHDRVNLVIVLGERFERYSLGAVWQDTLLSGKPHRVWGRCALVTGHSMIAEIIHSLAFLFPGDLRFFALDQEDAALAWAAGETAPDAS